MNKWLNIAALVMLGLSGPAALAAPGTPLEWAELPDPSAQGFEDPFRDLKPEQFDDLLFVLRLRNRLQQDAGSPQERQKWQALLIETEDALAADQVDVDWLLSQRQLVTDRRAKAATAGNPTLEGRTVTVTGFAIPAPPDADGRQVAYLVPQAGMCSHYPPPAPNQMIRVTLNGDWTPGYVYEPVRLTGRLAIAPSVQKMHIIDGLVPMRATFRLEAEMAEPLEGAKNRDGTLGRLKDRLRAATGRKTGGTLGAD